LKPTNVGVGFNCVIDFLHEIGKNTSQENKAKINLHLSKSAPTLADLKGVN